MEEKEIAVGQRLYRYFDDPEFGRRTVKGEVVKICKGLFGKVKYKVLWDDGKKGKYAAADVLVWVKNREDEQNA